MKNLNIDIKAWIVYFTVLLISVYVHEVGHCIPAWINGYWAFPTPIKEYISGAISESLQLYVSFFGVLGSIIVFLIALYLYLFKVYPYTAYILAGATVSPGLYTLRFVLVGRGHDATEFQEAQSAIGLSYNGHSLDWIFLVLFLMGVSAWILKARPGYRALVRLFPGLVLTFIFMGCLEAGTNYIFDPIFQSH